MYFTQMAKTRVFVGTTLPLNDSKQLSPVSNQVLDKSGMRIQRNCPKNLFLAKNGQKLQNFTIFGQNLENENFFKNLLGFF